jgi:hypothetical protein
MSSISARQFSSVQGVSAVLRHATFLFYKILDWQDKCDQISIRVRREVVTGGERLASLIKEAYFYLARARHETSLSASGLSECPLLALSEGRAYVAFGSGLVARHHLVLVRLFCEFA